MLANFRKKINFLNYRRSNENLLFYLNQMERFKLGDLSPMQGPVGGRASWGTLTCRISWAQFLF